MPTREEMQGLAQGIIASQEERTAGVAALRKSVASLRSAANAQIRDFGRAHKAMAPQQRAELAKGRRDLAGSVASRLCRMDEDRAAMAQRQRADLAGGHRELASGVKSQLYTLDTDHTAMAWQQRAELAKGRKDLAKAEVSRKSSVTAWMQETAGAHVAVRDEWHKLATTMQAKRGAIAVAEAPFSPPVHEAEAAAPESDVLSQRVLEHLAGRPEGAKLTELEQEFGLFRIQMALLLRSLMEENKVEKRDLLYFAIS